MPIVKWGETIQDELNSGWSREIEHDLAGEVTFPVFIDCVYQQGRCDEHGVARHGYAADAPFIDTPRDARNHYSKRFGIESSYRLAKQSLAFTSSQDAGLRLVMFVVSLLLPEQLAVSSLEVRGGAPPRGAASGDGRSRSSVRWCCGQPGQRLVCAGLFQRTNHSTTGSSGSCPPLGTAIVSGATLSRRRQSAADSDPHRRNSPSVSFRELTTHRRRKFNLYWRVENSRCDRLMLGHYVIGCENGTRDLSITAPDGSRDGSGYRETTGRVPHENINTTDRE